MGAAGDAALLRFRQLVTACSGVVQDRWWLLEFGDWMEVPIRTLGRRQGRRTAFLVAGGADYGLTDVAFGLGTGRVEPEYQALLFYT